MTNLDVGKEFACLHELNGLSPCNPQKAYSGAEFWQSSKCPADQDVHETALQKGSLVCEDTGIPIFSGELAKGYFNIDLRTDISQLSELGINIISHDLPQSNNATKPLEHSVPGKVSWTTKNGGVEFICQMNPSQTSSTQGSVWEKDLAVHDGCYIEGEHFQSSDNFRFSGSFGTGVRCVDLKTHKRFFMKRMIWNKFRPSEVLIPIHLDHENVTKLYGVILRNDMVDILMEDAGMSLTYFVMLNPKLDERLVLDLTKHGLAGLKELHKNDVVHHDIKPDNLCVCTNPNGTVRLIVTDFGSARSVNQPIDSMAWTPAYLAPEACRKVLRKLFFGNTDEQITGKVDVFALGLTALFMFKKQHVLLHKMTHGKDSYKDLSAEEKQKLDFYLLQYLAVWDEPPQDLFPMECSMEVLYLLKRMLSGAPDLRFSAREGLAFIDCLEVKQKQCQQTQNGRLVTHPSENHQDAGEMRAVNGGVKDLTKEKLRKKTLKNIKKREVLEGGTDVLAMTETVRQNAQPPMPSPSRKMETDIETRSVATTIQPLERAAGAINLGLLHALQVQVSSKHREPSILNGVYLNPAAQNSISQCQAGMSLGGKPEKRKHEAELHQHPGKKMRQSVSGDSTPLVPALLAPAIPYSVRGLSTFSRMDGEMKPKLVDDSSMHDQEGNIPDFSKLF